jgi:hypothetical protein
MVRLVAAVDEADRAMVMGVQDFSGIDWHVDPDDQTIILEASYA